MTEPGSLALIDAALRGGTVALLLLLSTASLRTARQAGAGAALYGGLFTLSVVAYVLNSSPALFPLPLRLGWVVGLPLVILSMGAPAMMWLFARAAFDDEFAPSVRDVLPWLAAVALGVACAFCPFPTLTRWFCVAFQAAQLGFVTLAIREALAGRSADLIEERRRFRVVLIISAALYSAAVITLDATLHGPVFAAPLSIANAAGLLLFTFAIALAQLTLSNRGQLVASPSSRPTPAAAAPPPDDQELLLLERLRRLMEAERAYRGEGLAVGTLSAKLGIPEYRLRRLINQRLGHRNFSSFVNGYRLAETMAALADPAQAEVPIVTIALDAGFQSLGPFNRAFKAHTGLTPTDYRRQQLTEERKSA